ncbi:MAG TPA: anti-sigma factor [Ramlibacter sp.]|uniref:anti-sigma factor family protein n=1 Tax=Ramlibacter sp. TaxID=1917967 RepID=UPI002ED52081
MNDDKRLQQDEAELHAFVDGRLDAAARAAVQARLDADPQAARTVAAWTEQKLALRALHAQLLHEPAPPLLAQAAQRLHHRSDSALRWVRWGGIAASVLLAFAAGWMANTQWQSQHEVQPIARARGPGEFARQAVLAHSVYLPEVRHPVEVDAAQQDHLVQWLSKRLNRPLKVPNLGAMGYELVGGRLLPGESGARAQFMYQNGSGQRVTLYVGAVDAKGTAETTFRYSTQGDVASFYWVDQGFGYALSGKLPRQGLLVLAESVYRQL